VLLACRKFWFCENGHFRPHFRHGRGGPSTPSWMSGSSSVPSVGATCSPRGSISRPTVRVPPSSPPATSLPLNICALSWWPCLGGVQYPDTPVEGKRPRPLQLPEFGLVVELSRQVRLPGDKFAVRRAQMRIGLNERCAQPCPNPPHCAAPHPHPCPERRSDRSIGGAQG
jgi:hypothetical protein